MRGALFVSVFPKRDGHRIWSRKDWIFEERAIHLVISGEIIAKKIQSCCGMFMHFSNRLRLQGLLVCSKECKGRQAGKDKMLVGLPLFLWCDAFFRVVRKWLGGFCEIDEDSAEKIAPARPVEGHRAKRKPFEVKSTLIGVESSLVRSVSKQISHSHSPPSAIDCWERVSDEIGASFRRASEKEAPIRGSQGDSPPLCKIPATKIWSRYERQRPNQIGWALIPRLEATQNSKLGWLQSPKENGLKDGVKIVGRAIVCLVREVFLLKGSDDSLKKLQWGQSSGPDCMSIAFLQSGWAVVKEYVMALFQHFHEHETFVNSLNASLIDLITKKGGAMNLKDFQPRPSGLGNEFKFHLVNWKKAVLHRDGKPMEESCGIKHPVQQWIIGILEWLDEILVGCVSTSPGLAALWRSFFRIPTNENVIASNYLHISIASVVGRSLISEHSRIRPWK
ncbi:hypothetical protein Acr_00g0070270 [Actinidia rufa]|uniref:Uncharacterized protein n=1 Tax=Actinidia rufa TaxID=165716 RepID=A0A7J0DRG4_9ERIC|nr:hypothetical protein Acr_00g0070270 [Actinidia rufa]